MRQSRLEPVASGVEAGLAETKGTMSISEVTQEQQTISSATPGSHPFAPGSTDGEVEATQITHETLDDAVDQESEGFVETEAERLESPDEQQAREAQEQAELEAAQRQMVQQPQAQPEKPPHQLKIEEQARELRELKEQMQQMQQMQMQHQQQPQQAEEQPPDFSQMGYEDVVDHLGKDVASQIAPTVAQQVAEQIRARDAALSGLAGAEKAFGVSLTAEQREQAVGGIQQGMSPEAVIGQLAGDQLRARFAAQQRQKNVAATQSPGHGARTPMKQAPRPKQAQTGLDWAAGILKGTPLEGS